MNAFSLRALGLLLALGLCGTGLRAAEPAAKNEVPGRKVDEPLPETYEPLMGSPRNDEDFSQELKQLRRIKEQQREEAERRRQEPAPVTGQKPPPPKSYPIQEPQPEATGGARSGTTPPVEEQGEELRIRDSGP